MSEPLIGFVITNHNYGEYLRCCLLSAMNQTYKNILICVVDDASTDNSREIIEELAQQDHRIIPIYNEKCVGPSTSRNRAIRRIWDKTDYFQILDSDDMCYPNKVEILLSKMLLSPMIGGCYGDYNVENIETGNVLREYKEPYSYQDLLKRCVVHSGSLISKAALQKIAWQEDEVCFYDKNLHGPATQEFRGSIEDYFLYLNIASAGFIFYHVPKALTLVRVHDRNASKLDKVLPVIQKNEEYMRKKLIERWPEKFVNNKS